jgi:hypothetical protein
VPNNLERYRSILDGMARGIEPTELDVKHIQTLSQRELLFLMKKLITECETAYRECVKYAPRSQEIIYYLCLGLKEPKMNEDDYIFFTKKITNAVFLDCLLDNPLLPLKYLVDEPLFSKFKDSIFWKNIEKRRKTRISAYNKHEIVYCLREQISNQLDNVEVLTDEMVLKITGFNVSLLNS